MSQPAPLLVLLCDVCHESVGDEGFLQVDEAAAIARIGLGDEWTERHRTREGSVSFSVHDRSDPPPEKVRWNVYHQACDPDPDNEGYWIASSRCATFAELVSWTAHLMEKQWIQQTDWSLKLRAILRDSGASIDN